jgi:hypothetical protein
VKCQHRRAFLGLKMLIPSPLRCSRGVGEVFGVFFLGRIFFGFDWVVSLVGLLFLGFDFWGLLMSLAPYTHWACSANAYPFPNAPHSPKHGTVFFGSRYGAAASAGLKKCNFLILFYPSLYPQQPLLTARKQRKNFSP